MAEVRLEGLTKVFPGKAVAVQDLTLHIKDGEFITLVGPSGCGKSTTLRMIAGLERPTKGAVCFDERDVTDDEPRDRNVGMVFQNYALYPHMTVRENLEYGLRKRGVPKGERRRRVERVAGMLRIEGLLERKPKELSGGQRQRVALGRAILRDPEVFLLDEPLSNLDAKLRVYMRAELIKLHRSLGTTMIYVTHDQLEALTMSDRIAVMQEGRLQQVGTPEEVYNAPANRFVAEFIGTPPMNLIEGELREEWEGLFLANEALTVQLPFQFRSTFLGKDVPKALTLGVRPEDVRLGAAGEARAIPGVVSVVELAGAERFVYVTVGDVILVARAEADRQIGVGDVVGICFTQRFHLFRNDTGQALI